MPQSIFATSASLSGPSVIRAGNTITIALKISGTKISGIQATITYDKSTLSFSSYSNKLGSKWNNSYSESSGTVKIVAYDQGTSNSINSGTVANITFKVSGNATVGSNFSIKLSGSAADKDAVDLGNFSANYTKTISAPLSSNANLSSLKVSEDSLSPSFQVNTTSYQVNVPFSVSKLTINAKAADSAAKVTVNNKSLTPGKTTSISIVVKAGNGSTKTYIIKATRAQDPNYVASNVNNIKSLEVKGFLLSPGYSQDNHQYIVYVPYETLKVEVVTKTVDVKADVIVSGNDELRIGSNEISVVCTAENGDENTYIINVQRAESFTGESSDEISSSNQQLLQIMNEYPAASYNEPITFYLNLIGASNKLVSGEIFAKLLDFSKATLIIRLEYGTVIFYSADIENVSATKYDFNLQINGNNSELIKHLISGDNNFIYNLSTNSEVFPGYATFKIATNLKPSKLLYLYKYDLENEQFQLIAKGMTIDDSGNFSYQTNIGGDFVISDILMPDVLEYESVTKQTSTSNVSFDKNLLLISVASAILMLIFGFLIGYMPVKLRFKKYIRNRKNEQ